MALEHDFTLDRGDTSFLVFSSITNLPAGGLNTYGALVFTAKRTKEDADGSAFVQKTKGSGVSVTVNGNASTPGTLTVQLDAADLATLPARETTLFYDVQVTDSTQSPHRIYTLAKGKLVVDADVTQATS
jgi:hypothetical protein